MSRRASMFGGGSVGGAVEYRGDLPAPVTTYASTLPKTPLMSMSRIPQTPVRAGAPFVDRHPRRGGHTFFYSHGGVRMQNALPYQGAAGIGSVNSSEFQSYNVQLMDWQINRTWHESGYPRNLAYSTRVPQLETNQTGGPGRSQQTQRFLYNRVQSVQRARVQVRTYATRGSRS